MRAPMSTATVAAVVLAAAPLGLLYLAGPDLIPGPPSGEQLRAWVHQPLTTGFLTALLQAAAWLLWALFATAVAHRVRQRVGARVRWRFALRLPGPLQGLAAALLGATAVTSAALPAAAHTTTSTADTSPPDLPPPADTLSPTPDRNLQRPAPLPTVAASSTDTRHAPPNSQRAADAIDHTRTAAPHRTTHTGGQPSSAARTTGKPAQADTCVVRPGDTLSAIAEQRLGDPDRWPEIWKLNRGTRFDTGGGTFTNPHLIHPGWTLRLPQDALPPATAIPRPPAPPEADAPEPRPTTPDKPATTPVPPASADTPPGPTASTPVDDAGPATPPIPSAEGRPARSTASGPTSSPPTQTSHGITVGSGSWLDVGLAAAIAAAAALIWALRRRHYQPRPPSPARRGDADLTPLPAVVTRIRRSLRQQHNDNDIGVDILDTTNPLDTAPEPAAAGDDVEDDTPASSEPRSHERSAADAAAPVVPALDNPAAVWPAAGLGLTGPGAHAAGRGFLTAALAAGDAHDPHTRGSVVIPSPTAATLLDPAVLPASPRLTVTRSLADALDLLETLALHRTRLVYQHEVDTIADLRHRRPHLQPQPPVLLIADTAARHERVRIAALLAQGQRLDIHGILLGTWPEGDTVVVATDGTTSPADETTRHTGAGHPADLGRLTVLTPADTIDLITTLTEAHTGTRQTPPTPATDLLTTSETKRGRADGTDQAEPGPSQAAAAETRPETGAVDGHTHAGAPAAADDRTEPTPRPDGRVAVRTLGTARIVDMDTTIPLRAKALELLVYLVVHDGDATQDAILDDLLPDAPRSKAPHRLHTYVSALRKTLTRTGGATGNYLTHPGRRYTLNRELIDADLWRMRDALRHAQRADNPDERLTALRTAVAAYQGALADGFDYEWIEAPREAIRRQALDAHLALAAATPDPAETITVLTTAIYHDPYAESVYQHAMRAHAVLGHLDQIHALRRTLTHRLHDIDTTPSQDTLALADQLITELQASSRDRSRPDARGQRP
ncbi:BTAD domain-containing putative transcriptional regulator [Micromonospora sp. NPDC048871]|uniref:BTAD domain-containing putative transcriptional regulator n=1 Tax=Micromonospora sp. NPDC048871 TaxID=3364259 RepID=UPI003715DFD1